MSLLSDFFSEEYNTQREQWEKSLMGELKLDQVQSKTTKKTLDAGNWPILSLQSAFSCPLPVHESWKKAAQTYVHLDPEKIGKQIQDDLEAGVRCFFFYNDFLKKDAWNKVQAILEKFSKASEVNVFIIGKEELIDAREVQNSGGNNIQELALLATKYIENLHQEKINVGVYVDSQFFKNIAKIRALKLLVKKIEQESKMIRDVGVVALTSFREWTLYERYSNMLRNVASVASAYIGGADYVQSSGYQILFDLELNAQDPEHSERSARMARNTSHILALESMLGVVQDAAYGSYHLESLSEEYAKNAWALMQKILPLKGEERARFLEGEMRSVREARLELIKTRKHILAGMNDFPNAKETLNLSQTPDAKIFRLAREFENLRIKMEKCSKRPRVFIALYGEYATLSSRVNFVKNYFEIIGLEVNDPSHTKHDLESFIEDIHHRSEDIVILCAADEDYPLLKDKVQNLPGHFKFVAGKNEISGFEPIYAGQDAFSVLEKLVSRWGRR